MLAVEAERYARMAAFYESRKSSATAIYYREKSMNMLVPPVILGSTSRPIRQCPTEHAHANALCAEFAAHLTLRTENSRVPASVPRPSDARVSMSMRISGRTIRLMLASMVAIPFLIYFFFILPHLRHRTWYEAVEYRIVRLAEGDPRE